MSIDYETIMDALAQREKELKEIQEIIENYKNLLAAMDCPFKPGQVIDKVYGRLGCIDEITRSMDPEHGPWTIHGYYFSMERGIMVGERFSYNAWRYDVLKKMGKAPQVVLETKEDLDELS